MWRRYERLYGKQDVYLSKEGLVTGKLLLLQKLADGFDLLGGAMPKTPLTAWQVLVKGDRSDHADANWTNKHHTRMALCMYFNFIQVSWPDIFYAAHGCWCHMATPRSPHEKALHHMMQYVVVTKSRWLVLSLDWFWDCDKECLKPLSQRMWV